MNLEIRGIDANLGSHNADSFHDDLHKDLKADYVLANPPFNDSDWGGDRLHEDARWKFGKPPINNANFAWVQHFIHHLAPSGIAGFVLANGSMSPNQSNEGEIRKALIEADLVDCMISLPGQLFYSAVKILGNEPLQNIAREFVTNIRKNLTIDWTVRECQGEATNNGQTSSAQIQISS